MPGTMGAEDASINRLIWPHGSQSLLLERKVGISGGREASVVATKWRHCWKRHVRECNDHRGASRRSSLTWCLDGGPDCQLGAGRRRGCYGRRNSINGGMALRKGSVFWKHQITADNTWRVQNFTADGASLGGAPLEIKLKAPNLLLWSRLGLKCSRSFSKCLFGLPFSISNRALRTTENGSFCFCGSFPSSHFFPLLRALPQTIHPFFWTEHSLLSVAFYPLLSTLNHHSPPPSPQDLSSGYASHPTQVTPSFNTGTAPSLATFQAAQLIFRGSSHLPHHAAASVIPFLYWSHLSFSEISPLY